MTFELVRLRLHFTAVDAVHFPPAVAGNILRGAFGTVFRDLACELECPGRSGADIRECKLRAACAYARTFEPAALNAGPSGLADQPRPFVFRASHLNDRTIPPGEPFWLDIHLFDTSGLLLQQFIQTFTVLADAGFGPGRARAKLVTAEDPQPLSITLDTPPQAVERIRIDFKTPTELKHEGKPIAKPDFGILFARIRDRISTLRSLYGAGPLDIDFAALGARAAQITMTQSDVQQIKINRRSSRTRQSHSIGGFTGTAEYAGALTEFIPYLELAQWTGVGRHCVWGNGEVAITEPSDRSILMLD